MSGPGKGMGAGESALISRRQINICAASAVVGLLTQSKQSQAQGQGFATTSSSGIGSKVLTGVVNKNIVELELDLDLERGAGTRLMFSTLRTTAELAFLSLYSPDKTRLWRKSPNELGVTPRQFTGRPELGDSIVVPEVRNPMPGKWRLLLEPVAGAHGQAVMSFRVLPRYELSLSLITGYERGPIAAGEPLVAMIRSLDYGVPIASSKSTNVQVKVLSKLGQVVAMPEVEMEARTPAGILLTQEPGTLVARFTLPDKGEFRIVTERTFAPESSPTKIELPVSAIGALGEVAWGGLSIVERQGRDSKSPCFRDVLFEFKVRVANAGHYSCNITVTGPSGARMANGSAELSAGPGLIKVTVPYQTVKAVGGAIHSLSKTNLIRIGSNDFRTIAEMASPTLSDRERLDLKRICTP